MTILRNVPILFVVLVFTGFACTSMSPKTLGAQPVDHSGWDAMLKKHVDKNGLVNYKGFKAEILSLDRYLKSLEASGPNDTWSKNEQLAYWINAYNAFTVKLILEYYPVESIKDIGSKIQIPFVNTAWDIKFINIGGEELSLNNIEHNIIRKNFEEPRIHFALVCAALSCPKLRNEAYDPDQLDNQLTAQTKSFLANPEKNQIKSDAIKLSKLFSWYGGDFTKKTSLIEYLNLYSPVEIDDNVNKSYMDYDWSLNEQ